MWELLDFKPINNSYEAFNKSVLVWLHRPNVCSKIISCCKVQSNDQSTDKISNSLNDHIPQKTKDLVLEFLLNANSQKCPCCNKKWKFFESTTLSYCIRKLVPRRHDLYKDSLELFVLLKNCFFFLPINDLYLPFNEALTYMIAFCKHCIPSSTCLNSDKSLNDVSLVNHGTLVIYTTNFFCQPVNENNQMIEISEKFLNCFVTKAWLHNKLFPTLCKWSQEQSVNSKSKMQLPSSLSLIDKEKYSILYHNLKIKHGIPITQIWPEVTDPQKFVYEDIAIAAYLLLLWEKERNILQIDSKQSFADLGCGNGLLVHILTSEGHEGIGYDVRKRKVWDLYDEKTTLKETAVTPDNLDLVRKYDWLLGNHSDELTPWIPVMACETNKRFWVLPCCFFDFYAKYERSQSANGQYHDYLSYITSIGQQCDFDVETDVMRIPSTKRVCLVGMKRHSEESNCDEEKKKSHLFVYQKFQALSNHSAEQLFVPRSMKIDVRNCTKIDRKIQNEVVETVSSHLLSFSNEVETPKGKVWNRGGKIPISDAVRLLSDNAKATLKQECGGLQTLLRNKNQIFEVSGGQVQIRNWALLETSSRKRKKKQRSIAEYKKTKRCWFHDHHPDGCPRDDRDCSFLHSEEAADA